MKDAEVDRTQVPGVGVREHRGVGAQPSYGLHAGMNPTRTGTESQQVLDAVPEVGLGLSDQRAARLTRAGGRAPARSGANRSPGRPQLAG